MDDGGAYCAGLAATGTTSLQTFHITSARPTAKAAFAFGRALAVTHAAGASHYGAAPDPALGDGVMGRAPLSFVAEEDATSWGVFQAVERIEPYIAGARNNGSIDASGVTVLERLCARLENGDYDHGQPALIPSGRVARIHGDLWSGNIMWAQAHKCTWVPDNAGRGPDDSYAARAKDTDIVGVLIDPAAQGGHAETDLAYLSVFGQPYLSNIYDGYNSVSPLEEGWQDRIGLHQMHILIIHAYLFGGSYGAETVDTARRYC